VLGSEHMECKVISILIIFSDHSTCWFSVSDLCRGKWV